MFCKCLLLKNQKHVAFSFHFIGSVQPFHEQEKGRTFAIQISLLKQIRSESSLFGLHEVSVNEKQKLTKTYAQADLNR